MRLDRDDAHAALTSHGSEWGVARRKRRRPKFAARSVPCRETDTRRAVTVLPLQQRETRTVRSRLRLRSARERPTLRLPVNGTGDRAATWTQRRHGVQRGGGRKTSCSRRFTVGTWRWGGRRRSGCRRATWSSCAATSRRCANAADVAELHRGLNRTGRLEAFVLMPLWWI